MKWHQESIDLLQSALKKKDDDYKLYFALARSQYLSGEAAAGEVSLRRTRELAPKEMVAYYERPLKELVAEQN